MIRWSLIAGLIGVLATWFLTLRLERAGSRRQPELFWMLGLAALGPAWLIAVFGLLGRMSGRFPEMSMAAWWIVSSAAAVLGVIVTDGMVRRLRESDQPRLRARCWLAGIGAFFPAWCLALLGLLRSIAR